jgi:acyl-CoA synthetase (AMP-forming)/AMP-acid ligase II
MDLSAIVAELKKSTDTFGPFIRTQAEAIPDRIALKFETETVTYAGYQAHVNRLAWVLAQSGVTAGQPVAILAPNSPLFIAALGAVAKLGAIGALINTHVTGAGLTHVLRASGAAVGLCDASALPALAEIAGTHPVRFHADAPAGTATPADVRLLGDTTVPDPAPEPDIPDVRGGDVFLYIYTSGTTGYPKPAIVRHLRFTMGGISLSQMLGVEAGETIYAPLPLYHGESLFVGLAPAFRAGGAFASRRTFSASAFLDDVRRHEAVAFVYVGELCRYLLRQPPSPHDRDHRLRVAAGAGSARTSGRRSRSASASRASSRCTAPPRATSRSRTSTTGPAPSASRTPCSRTRWRSRASTSGRARSSAARTAAASRATSTSRARSSARSASRARWSTTATPIGRRRRRSSSAASSRPTTPGSGAAISCAATPRATTTSSTAWATRSAGRGRTSRRWRSPIA